MERSWIQRSAVKLAMSTRRGTGGGQRGDQEDDLLLGELGPAQWFDFEPMTVRAHAQPDEFIDGDYVSPEQP